MFWEDNLLSLALQEASAVSASLLSPPSTSSAFPSSALTESLGFLRFEEIEENDNEEDGEEDIEDEYLVDRNEKLADSDENAISSASSTSSFLFSPIPVLRYTLRFPSSSMLSYAPSVNRFSNSRERNSAGCRFSDKQLSSDLEGGITSSRRRQKRRQAKRRHDRRMRELYLTGSTSSFRFDSTLSGKCSTHTSNKRSRNKKSFHLNPCTENALSNVFGRADKARSVASTHKKSFRQSRSLKRRQGEYVTFNSSSSGTTSFVSTNTGSGRSCSRKSSSDRGATTSDDRSKGSIPSEISSCDRNDSRSSSTSDRANYFYRRGSNSHTGNRGIGNCGKGRSRKYTGGSLGKAPILRCHHRPQFPLRTSSWKSRPPTSPCFVFSVNPTSEVSSNFLKVKETSKPLCHHSDEESNGRGRSAVRDPDIQSRLISCSSDGCDRRPISRRVHNSSDSDISSSSSDNTKDAASSSSDVSRRRFVRCYASTISNRVVYSPISVSASHKRGQKASPFAYTAMARNSSVMGINQDAERMMASGFHSSSSSSSDSSFSRTSFSLSSADSSSPLGHPLPLTSAVQFDSLAEHYRRHQCPNHPYLSFISSWTSRQSSSSSFFSTHEISSSSWFSSSTSTSSTFSKTTCMSCASESSPPLHSHMLRPISVPFENVSGSCSSPSSSSKSTDIQESRSALTLNESATVPSFYSFLLGSSSPVSSSSSSTCCSFRSSSCHIPRRFPPSLHARYHIHDQATSIVIPSADFFMNFQKMRPFDLMFRPYHDYLDLLNRLARFALPLYDGAILQYVCEDPQLYPKFLGLEVPYRLLTHDFLFLATYAYLADIPPWARPPLKLLRIFKYESFRGFDSIDELHTEGLVFHNIGMIMEDYLETLQQVELVYPENFYVDDDPYEYFKGLTFYLQSQGFDLQYVRFRNVDERTGGGGVSLGCRQSYNSSIYSGGFRQNECVNGDNENVDGLFRTRKLDHDDVYNREEYEGVVSERLLKLLRTWDEPVAVASESTRKRCGRSRRMGQNDRGGDNRNRSRSNNSSRDDHDEEKNEGDSLQTRRSFIQSVVYTKTSAPRHDAISSRRPNLRHEEEERFEIFGNRFRGLLETTDVEASNELLDMEFGSINNRTAAEVEEEEDDEDPLWILACEFET